jgi:hypothetical protein
MCNTLGLPFCPARRCASGSDISLPQAAAAVRLDFPSSHPSDDLDRMQGIYTPSRNVMIDILSRFPS